MALRPEKLASRYGVNLQPRESSDVTEVLVEGKKDGSIFKSKSCDDGIDGSQCHAPRAHKPDQAGGIPIRLEALRLKQIPKAQVAFNEINVPAKSLEYLDDDDAAQGERFGFSNQPPEFTATRSRCLAKEIDPD